ncbi:MAG: isochorismatase family protein [Nanoarchaeota archaeon]|nr:isochorismatase family protein [Nanoarchaeota archaeon]
MTYRTDISFWDVDTRYDFMRNDEDHKGALYVPGAERIEPALKQLTQIAAQKNIRVIQPADEHDENSEEISTTPNFMTTFPAHCMRGTKGQQCIPTTAVEGTYVVHWDEKTFDPEKIRTSRVIEITKDKFDIFYGTPAAPHTEKIFELVKTPTAVVYGVCTNVCDDYAVMGLRARGIEVYVPMDAIKELPTLPLDATLDKWRNAGVHFTTVNELEKMLE